MTKTYLVHHVNSCELEEGSADEEQTGDHPDVDGLDVGDGGQGGQQVRRLGDDRQHRQ